MMTTVDATALEPAPVEGHIEFEDAPLRSFHLRLGIASIGGVFSDGYGLGIIGLSLSLATSELGLTPVWLGLIGGAALAGLFAGALLTGPYADTHGRRPVYASNMILLGLLSVAQFYVRDLGLLLALRLGIGFVLGTDYVVSKTLLSELMPQQVRGRILSFLSVAWAGGYASAYFVGFALTANGSTSWRWLLLTSAVPCLLVIPLRLTIPESPVWLVKRGDLQRAQEIVQRVLGPRVMPPPTDVHPFETPRTLISRWSILCAPPWRRHTIVGCVFFTCQVIPYFAVGTFVSQVLIALQLQGGYMGGLVYNSALLLGAVAGVFIVHRLPRRRALIGSFAMAASAMLILSTSSHLGRVAVIGLFALFASVLSAASNLVYVYLPELFPTQVRASGIGLAIACSRIGSAVSTFLLPIVVAGYGVRAALGACVVVLSLGAVLCAWLAPETRGIRISEAAPTH